MLKTKFFKSGFHKATGLFIMFLLGGFVWGQEDSGSLIRETDYVLRTPDNCQGYLVMRSNIAGVDSWKVEVFKSGGGDRTLIHTYQTNGELNYVPMDPAHYESSTNTIVISGLDADDGVIITETHEPQAIGEGPHPVPLGCEFVCNGPNYAWKVYGYENPVNTQQSLKLGQAYATPPTTTIPGVYFFENVNALDQAYFDSIVIARSISLAVPGGHYGVRWSGPHTVQAQQSVVDRFGVPITVGDPYYKVYKNLGDWQPNLGTTTGFQTPNLDYCLMNMNGIINVMNTDSDVTLERELECTGTDYNWGGTMVSTGTYTEDFVDCLMELPVLPNIPTYDSEVGSGSPWGPLINLYEQYWFVYNLVDFIAYDEALNDCYGTSVAPSDPDVPMPTMPSVAEINLIPIDVVGDLGDGISFTRDKNDSQNMVESILQLPDGLYLVSYTLMDGSYIITYQEKVVNSSTADGNEFNFTISPNPTTFGTTFSVNLLTAIEGDAQVQVFDVITGEMVLQGSVNNDEPFTGSIESGNRSYFVNVFNASQSASQTFILN